MSYFDPHHRRVARKDVVWDQIKRGQLMNLSIDFESSGLDRQNVPYATPSYPIPTEYGDFLTDLAGNPLNAAQILVKRPEWHIPQVQAEILQRVGRDSLPGFDSEERTNLWTAMAEMVWRIERAAHAYPEFGDKKDFISFMEYNKQFTDGKKPGGAEVISIPLQDEHGDIVHHVRYHADRGYVSYKVDDNPDSSYFWGGDNLYYIDEQDGSRWVWKEASTAVDGFNFLLYDSPFFRDNLRKLGFAPRNAGFLYMRGTATDKQKNIATVADVRHLAYATALYGPQGEDGLKLGEITDPQSGALIRRSEALVAYHQMNSRAANPIRLLRGGLRDPMDGALFDPAQAHGAVADAAATAALRIMCMDIAPDIYRLMSSQVTEKEIKAVLEAQSPQQNKLPLYALPRRHAGKSHSSAPYFHLGSDAQDGDFKKEMFLLANGAFHKGAYHSSQSDKPKPYHELSAEEWAEYLTLPETVRNPDRPLRSESIRRWPGVMAMEDVFKYTSQAKNYRDFLPEMSKDLKYIDEHPEMLETMRSAIGLINRQRRQNRHHPQVPLLEDDLPTQNSKVLYQEPALAEERRRLWKDAKRAGQTRIVPGVLETVKNGMQNVYELMGRVDEKTQQLALTPHPIDLFVNGGGKDIPDDEQDLILEKFKILAEKAYEVYSGKNEGNTLMYAQILHSLKKPNGEPYFEGKKLQVETVQEARRFRLAVGKRILQDYETLLRQGTSDYIHGEIDKGIFSRKFNGRPLFLFADADNGAAGGMPYVARQNGAEVPLDHILQLGHYGAGMNQVLAKLVDSDEWHYRFFRLRSEPSIMRLAQRFVDLGQAGHIPDMTYEMYKADRQHRLYGKENETVTTSSIPTVQTELPEIQRLKLAAILEEPLILERGDQPSKTISGKVLQYDEAARILEGAEQRLLDIQKEMPYDPALTAAGGYDLQTGLPYDHIANEIIRDSRVPFLEDKNFVVLDVPLWHVAQPIKTDDETLTPRGLIIPDISKEKRRAIHDYKKPVIIRVPETGQLYSPGPVKLQFIRNFDDPALSTIARQARTAYESAGQPLAEQSNIYWLGIEDLYPIANTREIATDIQSFKIPHSHFYGLVAPRWAAVGDTPLMAMVLPVDYVSQKLAPGQPVLFQEMNMEMFGNISGKTAPGTGQSYQTVLRDVIGMDGTGRVKGLAINDFNRAVKSGKLSADVVRAAGFMGPEHLDKRLSAWVTEKWKPQGGQQKIIVALFDQVNKDYFASGRDETKNMWGMFNMYAAPEAALLQDGRPVPPYAYRTVPRVNLG